MKLDDFITRVQQQGHFDDRLKARNFSTSVLTTLAYRLPAGESQDLASQLPHELKNLVMAKSGQNFRFGRDEFVQRVATETDSDQDTADRGIHAVLHVLKEAISPGEIDDVIDELPPDLKQLIKES